MSSPGLARRGDGCGVSVVATIAPPATGDRRGGLDRRHTTDQDRLRKLVAALLIEIGIVGRSQQITLHLDSNGVCAQVEAKVFHKMT
jgi:hypothetical protein